MINTYNSFTMEPASKIGIELDKNKTTEFSNYFEGYFLRFTNTFVCILKDEKEIRIPLSCVVCIREL